LGNAGTVHHVGDYHTFIPTVSALAISSSVAPHSEVIPANAAALSPFDALYHFGTHSNTGHLEDYDDWLSDVLVHELRIATGEFTLNLKNSPLSIGWHGLYQLEHNPGLSTGWSPVNFDRHGIYPVPQPAPNTGFHRLRFLEAYQ
jgi:hypothetical protein